jgi:hypothetical protein
VWIRAARLIRALDFYLMNYIRLYLAFLVSPLVLPLAIIVYGMLHNPFHKDIIVGIITLTPLYYFAALIFGVPMFFLYRALGWENVFAYILGGVIIGSVSAFLFFSLLDYWGQSNAKPELGVLSGMAIVGGLSALVAWLFLYGFKSDEAVNDLNNGEI